MLYRKRPLTSVSAERTFSYCALALLCSAISAILIFAQLDDRPRDGAYHLPVLHNTAVVPGYVESTSTASGRS